MDQAQKRREGFGSKLGFIMATAGSAVGLGNIWRFPYLAAQYGGGVFLLMYLILTVTFGFSLVLTEIAIGRRTGKSVLGAYKQMNKSCAFMGWAAAVIPGIILSYYCVIGGWVLKYMTVFITGSGTLAAVENTETGASFFSDFISDLGGPAVFFVIYVLLNAAVILFGVQNGIEKVSKVLMPLLVLLIVGIDIYSIMQEGALEGVKYYLLPNFADFTAEKFFKTFAAASSQLFYSLSIAMGILVTYGSYMRKEDSIEKSVRQIEVFDTGIAVLAGLIIVPSVFVFSGGNTEALNKGPGLMFITLPKVFANMRGGQIIGAVFFILVSLAALTSSLSLMETVVSAVMEKFRLDRKLSCALVTGAMLLLGMLSVLGYSAWSGVTIFGMQFLDFFDFITNSLMMPLLALVTCIVIGYVVKTAYIEEEVLHGENKFGSRLLYRVMIKYVCPVCLVIILVTPFVTNI